MAIYLDADSRVMELRSATCQPAFSVIGREEEYARI